MNLNNNSLITVTEKNKMYDKRFETEFHYSLVEYSIESSQSTDVA